MLDTATKRRIDTARDILVGKVPDPKSQVEQITIALIYKFMDDIDAESEELGGQRTFFAGEFAGYGWAKLMRAGLGGHEMLNLYAEAIARLPENPGMPPLFRSIFNNAYLPYRDPETLRAFLKVIDEFTYDHSERLGDAFEYLLSVLGSQGDAGQFRTPRHIIDFMVAVMDPQKDQTVLDPACGTAGFLISSYKHILKANTDAEGHSVLTPDEKGALATNFRGYDISPDMVRLSLVNLYLHGFVEPHIAEYDTLTSEERWNEYADVILANPPFMSPKGGIRPHNRFSVQSKRSEVLFVDYIAEHLTPAGRAGVIVPEGIIFQSQRAHKQLRKMLVEEYLVAVVSLPAGVFQPYSGVKTSILLLDRSLATKTEHIAFFKVENDGFDLGAQRREIAENDLPKVKEDLGEYLGRLRSGEAVDDFRGIEHGLIVGKERVAEGGEYNLSGERYRAKHSSRSEWPSVRVRDVFKRAEETLLPVSLHGPVNYVGLENVTQTSGQLSGNVVTDNPAEIKSLKNVFCPRDILYGKLRPNLNKVWLSDREGICSTDIFVIRPLNDERVLPALYAYIFRSGHFNNAVLGQLKGAQLPRIGWQSFTNLEIPLPPLKVQREIVAEIEDYQRVIDGARAVVENYRPHIAIDPQWPMVALGEVISLEYGRPLKAENRIEGPYPVYGSNGIVGYHNECLVEGPAIIVGRKGSAGAVNFCETPCYPIDTTFFVRIRERQQLDVRFCYYQMLELELDKVNVQSGVPGLNRNDAYLKTIAVPPLETQQALVAEIEAEQALVDGSRELIERFEKKIRDAVGRVWS